MNDTKKKVNKSTLTIAAIAAICIALILLISYRTVSISKMSDEELPSYSQQLKSLSDEVDKQNQSMSSQNEQIKSKKEEISRLNSQLNDLNRKISNAKK